jgi:S1-C subfamily serine protease
MFTNACKFYLNLICSVGGGSPTVEGKLHGKGCLLSPNHALTALHVVDGMLKRYQWVVVMKHDGLFKADVLFRSPELDIALLKTSEKIADFTPDTPLVYPTIRATNPFLGLSVGFIGVISLEGDTEKEIHTSFSQASTSYFFEEKNTGGLRYALTGGLVQHGFSGGPVFTSDLDLVGLIVMSQRFALDMTQPLSTMYNLPVMSPLAPIRDQINNSIGFN